MNPVDVVADSGVCAGLSGAAAALAVAHDARGEPVRRLVGDAAQQRAARVALARVAAPLHHAGADLVLLAVLDTAAPLHWDHYLTLVVR